MGLFHSPRQRRFVMAKVRRSNGKPEEARIDRDEMVGAVRDGTKDGFKALGQKVGQAEDGIREELRAVRDGLGGDIEKLAERGHADSTQVVAAIERVNDTLRSRLR